MTETKVDPAPADGLLLGALPAILPSFDLRRVAADLAATFPVHEAVPYRLEDGRFRGVAEGRGFRLEVGWGTVALRSWDPARRERRADNRDTDPFAPISRRGGWGEVIDRWDAEGQAVAGDVAAAVGALASAGLVPAGQAAVLARVAGLQEPFVAVESARPGVGGSRSRRISEWSAKSRARMLRAFAEIDYRQIVRAGGFPCMVTLTYPGRWWEVAPTAGEVKRHLRVLRERWARAFGVRPAGLWKLEFQARGAPHFHIFVAVPARAPSPFCDDHFEWVTYPFGDVWQARVDDEGIKMRCECWTFEEWLGWTWPDIVDAQGSEFVSHVRVTSHRKTLAFGAASLCTDPRRLAIYFLKHGVKSGDKAYQNDPPALWGEGYDTSTGELVDEGGTGRFWGVWGLDKPRAAHDLRPRDFYRLRRVIRAWQLRQGQTVRSWGVGGGNAGGWLLVNDGPGFAAMLSRALAAMG